MTLGERLQQLRKEKQMSQEELGNLLLVSRQTVSLWENNQTVPTVDNLVRLKEIFGVSIDSILTGEEADSPEQISQGTQAPVFESQLLERHVFSFKKADTKYFCKIFTMPLLKKLVVGIFLTFLSIFPTYGDTSEEQGSYFLLLMMLIFLCVSLVKYIRGLSATKKYIESVCNRKYVYELFDNYILVRVLNADDEIKTYKIYCNEFTRCWETPFCYLLEIKNNTCFVVNKADLGENCRLDYFCRNLKTSKTDFSSAKVTFLKTLGNFFFIACFISFFTAITVFLDTAPQNPESIQEGMQSIKIFHYLLPIPVLSIITGIILNANKIRNKKNIICGVLIGLLMFAYGSIPTVYENLGNNMDAIEVQLGFAFPQTTGMNFKTTTDISGDEQSVATLNFAESDANKFEEFMQGDDRWIKDSNDDIKTLVPESYAKIPADYFLIYNKDTAEFGKIPDSDGKYHFIYVAYNSEMNSAYVYEYSYTVK